MSWIYLIAGSFVEIGWATGVSLIDGDVRPGMVVAVAAMLIISFWLFSKSLTGIPVSTAYAVFTGIGSVGTVVVGMAFLGDHFSLLKVLLIAALIGCIIGLKFIPERKAGEAECRTGGIAGQAAEAAGQAGKAACETGKEGGR